MVSSNSIDDRLAGGNLEPGDVVVGDVRQVLDQRAQRIAVGGDQHRLAAGKHRQDIALPIGQHALDGELEAFGVGDRRSRHSADRRRGRTAPPASSSRRRGVEAAAPDLHLLLAVLLGGFGLVEPGQPAIVPLVEAPVLGLGDPQPPAGLEREVQRLDRARLDRGEGDGRQQVLSRASSLPAASPRPRPSRSGRRPTSR